MVKNMNQQMPRLDKPTTRQRISEFFFAEEVPYGMAIMRMLLPLGPLIVMSQRWPHTRELFSSDGAPSPLWINYSYPDLLPIPSGTVAVVMMSALLLCLLTTMVGWRTKLSASIAAVFYTYLNLLDCSSTMTKYSVIACHGLMLLAISQSGAVWSVDSWLKSRKRKLAWPGEPALEQPKFAAWPRRLSQLLIGAVYFGAGITKMHTDGFFTGDQLLSWFQTSVNNQHPFGVFLTQYPWLIISFCYIAVVWEVAFIFVCWQGWSRFFALALGTIFHIMTALTLGLLIFPIVCISMYAAFLNETDFQDIFARVRRWKRRRSTAASRLPKQTESMGLRRILAATRIPSPVAFVAVVAGVMTLGVAAEHKLDPYGIRRPEGKHQLRPVDIGFVEQSVLGRPKRIRLIDKFDHVKFGSLIVSGVLSDPRTEFSQGDKLTAQVQLDPVHEDMWVECVLRDSDDRKITAAGQIVPRALLRANYLFPLGGELEPGTYQIVVTASGNEVMRKAFTLKPGKVKSAPLAN